MAYSPTLYMHDLDKKAFDALNMFPHFVKLQNAYITNVDEKAAKIEFLSTAIRLSEKQIPEVYTLLPPICEKLGIVTPDLYMVQSKDKRDLNAFTGGITTPFVCVTSELIKQMSPQMVSSVLAHECGHIACKHYLYHSLAMNFVNGIAASPLSKIPAIRKHLSKALVTALLFWDRCSELSADRAAVLCDGDAGKTIDTLLKVHGFEDNINRDEFINQALDLKAFVNNSQANKMMEQMIVQWNSHPLLATRAYECYDWEHSDRFQGIVNGTLTEKTAQAKDEEAEESEIFAVEISERVENKKTETNAISPEIGSAVEDRLRQVSTELERYTNHADKTDYTVAIASGILAGVIDHFFVGEFSLKYAHAWGSDKTERFVTKIAKSQGYTGDDPKGAIRHLAEKAPHKDNNIKQGFHLAADTNTNDFGGGKQHHLRDFAHHASITGLLFSVLTQFTEKSYGTDTSGAFIVVDVGDRAFIGKDVSQKLLFGIVYWFFHLVSDVAGSGDPDSEGTGIPGPILSAAKLLATTPLFKDKVNDKGNREFSVFISKLFNGTYFGERDENGKLIPLRFDFRTELGIVHHLEKQALPVLINEVCVRAFYMIRRLVMEIADKQVISFADLEKLDWARIKPTGNRTIDRMLSVASVTFSIADTADAAVHAAIESGGNWVIFSGKFVGRYNYVGAGRAAIAIVKEISNEKKEAQLIHERMILMDAKAQIMYQQLQEFKAKLDEKLTGYLVEDIEAFMEGFDDINEGLRTNNSDLVIHGNVTIQRVLGREVQFTTQQEFDELMDSDIPLQL